MMNEAARSDAAYEAACSSWQAKAGSRGLIGKGLIESCESEYLCPAVTGGAFWFCPHMPEYPE